MSQVVRYDKAKTQDGRPPLGDDQNGRSHEGRDVFGVTATTTKTTTTKDDDKSSHVEKRKEVEKRRVEQDDDDDDKHNICYIQ